MRLTQKLLLTSALTIFMTSQGLGSETLKSVDDDGMPSRVTASSTFSVPSLDGTFDLPGENEAKAFLSYFWDTLSHKAQEVTKNFIEQPLKTLFQGSDDGLETQRKTLFDTLLMIPFKAQRELSEIEKTRMANFQAILDKVDINKAKEKIQVGKEIKKLLNDQTDLLKNYYLIPLETGDMDEATDLTQSLCKTVSDANVSPARRAELELRKKFALNNFRHLLEYGQNSIALDRDMFVNLIHEAMTTKALLSKDIGTWKNFALKDLAEPFMLFKPVPSEASTSDSATKDKAVVTSKVYEMLPIILADENKVEQPETYMHPFVEIPTLETAAVTSKKTKIDDIRVKPETEAETLQINVTEDGELVHDYMMGFVTYVPRQHKGTPMPAQSSTSLFWRMLGYK